MQEFIFTLPISQKSGAMRLATTQDELDVMKDERIKKDPSLVKKFLLKATLLDIEGEEPTLEMIDALNQKDYEYLCDFYIKINSRSYNNN